MHLQERLGRGACLYLAGEYAPPIRPPSLYWTWILTTWLTLLGVIVIDLGR